MDLLLAVIGILCLLMGPIGCLVPVLPGPPIGYAGLVILGFCRWTELSGTLLLVLGAAALAVTVLDFYLPAWFTKKFGGSRAATVGSVAGMVAGLFILPPWGIIFCPFLGAFLGELIHDSRDHNKAFRVAMGAFAAFAAGTGLKLVTCFVMLYYGIASFFA
ncbi:MAG: DUF456 domain-containing protein [Rikenellaceae bacterium]|nr:DUF456 domain-containing protein [Rikenellaceae bacterium]